MIRLFKPFVSNNAGEFVGNTLFSGQLAEGPNVKMFEWELMDLWWRDDVVTTNSCTSALHLAFDIIRRSDPNIGPGIIASPITCAANVMPAIANGFHAIRWADVGADFNIDFNSVKKLMSADTQVLTFVHWAGTPVNFDLLYETIKWYKKTFKKPLYVVEDCAHCYNPTWREKRISTLMRTTNFKCYSFQAIKHLTTGDGGCLVCPSKYTQIARQRRWFGLDRDKNVTFRSYQDIPEWGYKFHMNDISAAIGLANIGFVQGNVDKAIENTHYYHQEINPDKFMRAVGDINAGSSYWLYSGLVGNRDHFVEYMTENNIEVSRVHSRIDTKTCMKGWPPAEGFIDLVDDMLVNIPVGWWITKDQREHIVRTINNYEATNICG